MTPRENNTDEKDSPDLQDNLYVVDEGDIYLLANRCSTCDRVHFPKHHYCAKCGSPALDEFRLSPIGKIGAFSLIDRQPADAFIQAPYIQAEIEMPEGISVFTVIDAPSIDALAIGMNAKVALKVYETPGGPKNTYIFRAIKTQGETHDV